MGHPCPRHFYASNCYRTNRSCVFFASKKTMCESRVPICAWGTWARRSLKQRPGLSTLRCPGPVVNQRSGGPLVQAESIKPRVWHAGAVKIITVRSGPPVLPRSICSSKANRRLLPRVRHDLPSPVDRPAIRELDQLAVTEKVLRRRTCVALVQDKAFVTVDERFSGSGGWGGTLRTVPDRGGARRSVGVRLHGGFFSG